MDKNKKPAFAEVTDDMIQGWKASHGDANGEITSVEIPLRDAHTLDEKPEHIPKAGFILAVPSRTVIDRVAELGDKREILQANKVLIANCVLAGDMDLLERDGNVYTAVLQEIQKLQRSRVASVKKL